MICSNEPGYYEDGNFGVRIENLVVVKEVETPNRFGGAAYLGFERLTLVPIQVIGGMVSGKRRSHDCQNRCSAQLSSAVYLASKFSFSTAFTLLPSDQDDGH